MFAALEKPHTNLHWHVRAEFHGASDEVKASYREKFLEGAERMWRAVVPSGTVHLTEVYDEWIADYLAKSARGEKEHAHFVVPDERLVT